MKTATTKKIANVGNSESDSLVFFNTTETFEGGKKGYPQLLYNDPSVGIISYSGVNTFLEGAYYIIYQNASFQPPASIKEASLKEALPGNHISKPGDTAILHEYTYSGTNAQHPGSLVTDLILIYYKISQNNGGTWVKIFSGTSVISIQEEISPATLGNPVDDTSTNGEVKPTGSDTSTGGDSSTGGGTSIDPHITPNDPVDGGGSHDSSTNGEVKPTGGDTSTGNDSSSGSTHIDPSIDPGDPSTNGQEPVDTSTNGEVKPTGSDTSTGDNEFNVNPTLEPSDSSIHNERTDSSVLKP